MKDFSLNLQKIKLVLSNKALSFHLKFHKPVETFHLPDLDLKEVKKNRFILLVPWWHIKFLVQKACLQTFHLPF